jgi:hypothetical protein
MMVQNTHWFTIVKNKTDEPYYDKLIGQSFILIRVEEERPDKVTLRRRTNIRNVFAPLQLYFTLDAKRHCYDKDSPTMGLYTMWEKDEVRLATDEEIQQAMMRRCAERI